MKTPWGLSKKEYITVLSCFTCSFLVIFDILIVSSNLNNVKTLYDVDYSVVMAFSQMIAVSYIIFFLAAIAFTDKLGKRKSLQTGLFFLAVFSALCAVSWDMSSLIVFRLLSGIGVALIQTSCISIIVDIVDKRYLTEAMALGYSIDSIAAIITPLIGLATASLFGINLLFLMIAPVCFVLIYLLRGIDNKITKPDLKINYAAHIAYVVAILLIVSAIFFKYDLPLRMLLLSIGAVSFIVFVWINQKSTEKIFDAGLFKIKTFAVGVILGFVFLFSVTGIGNSILQFLQLEDKELLVFGAALTTTFIAAALMSMKPFFQMLFAPIIARRNRDRESDKVLLIGCILLLVSIALTLIVFQIDNAAFIVIAITIVFILHAFALSYFIPYNKKIVLSSVPDEERNTASSISAVVSTTSSIAGIVVMINFISTKTTAETFWTSAMALNIIILIASIAITFVIAKHLTAESD